MNPLSSRMWSERVVPYVLRRDHGVCHLCGHPGADTADHILPRSLHPEVAPFDTSNLKAAHHKPCAQCTKLAGRPIRCNNIRQDRPVQWARDKIEKYTGRKIGGDAEDQGEREW